MKTETRTLTLVGKPLISTEFLASSLMSQELNFQTCAAILNSSINGSAGEWRTLVSRIKREKDLENDLENHLQILRDTNL